MKKSNTSTEKVNTNDCFRSEAEKHWQFIQGILTSQRVDREDTDQPATVSLEACHYLYVEAMVHGYKHAKEEKPQKNCESCLCRDCRVHCDFDGKTCTRIKEITGH